MTRKEQIKILNDKIKSNTNQYKIDRLNAEISAFSSGDLNKYEFFLKKVLNYKPNALDKAKFEFSPLGEAFSTRLDKTAKGYQDEGVIKLLKDIRDGLAGGAKRPNDNDNNDDNNDDYNNDNDNNDDNNNDNNDNDNNDNDNNDNDNNDNNNDDNNNNDNDNNDDNNDDNDDDNKSKVKYKRFIKNIEKDIDNFNKKLTDRLNILNDKISTLNDKISKIKHTIKNNKTLTNAERNELQNKIKDITTQQDSINSELRHEVNVIKKQKKRKKRT